LELSLEVSLAAFSDSIESVWEGSSFWVSAFIHDDRDDPLGVVGGAVDIQFDPATVVPTGNVAYGDGFDHFQQGQPDAAAGVIDETGAITTGIGVGVDTFAPFVAWEFVRTSPFGNEAPSLAASFQLDPAEGSDTILPADFALIGLGSPLAPAQIRLGSTEVNLYDADLNDDRVVDHFDLAMFQMHADSSAGDDAYDPTADLNGDSEIDQEDLELVMAAMYQPVSEALTEPEDSATDELLADANEADDGLLSDAFLSAVDDYFANDLS
jgi:hypothetical protein